MDKSQGSCIKSPPAYSANSHIMAAFKQHPLASVAASSIDIRMVMPAIQQFIEKRCPVAFICIAMTLALLSGCAALQKTSSNDKPIADAAEAPVSSWLPRAPATGFLLPVGIFDQPTSSSLDAATAPTPDAVAGSLGPSTPGITEVLLYASPSTQKYLASGGVDGKFSSRLWETFLRKYKIPFRAVLSVEQLETSQTGVLLLPSNVALSAREQQAIKGFREKGGSVLATWLTGVRGENGEWLGFDFMEQTLDAKVIGNTEANEDVTYLIPHGDNPVTHHLPAGLRVWLERAKEWYPLRMLGRQAAGQVMDWGRSYDPDQSSATIVFDERRQSSGRPSRSVVLGYPERLWLSSEPKLLEAVAHNALLWLLRQPDAYLSAWPYPHASALVMMVDATDVVVELDSSFAKMVEDAGGRASFYVLTDVVPKSAAILKKIQARGHEIAFLGDKFEAFKDQSAQVQTMRLDGMRKVVDDAGITIAADAGIHAPLEAYDETTEALLREQGFRYYVTSNGATDTRLPFLAASASNGTNASKPIVILPRTQVGPEDAMEEGDPEVALQNFLNELALSQNMAGLSLIRTPNQSLLTTEQLDEIFKHIKAQRERVWLATARQVAQWWRERERVSVRLDASAQGPRLTVKITGEGPLEQAVAVWVNLPDAVSALRLEPHSSQQKMPTIASVDRWRAAVVLAGLPPGEYQWSVHFDRPSSGAKR